MFWFGFGFAFEKKKKKKKKTDTRTGSRESTAPYACIFADPGEAQPDPQG
tara:strand:- start:432 stop:581 length:150 start_codon:yes stop_codon:yes gene_type:complete